MDSSPQVYLMNWKAGLVPHLLIVYILIGVLAFSALSFSVSECGSISPNALTYSGPGTSVRAMVQVPDTDTLVTASDTGVVGTYQLSTGMQTGAFNTPLSGGIYTIISVPGNLIVVGGGSINIGNTFCCPLLVYNPYNGVLVRQMYSHWSFVQSM